MLRRINNVVLAAGTVLAVAGFWQRDDLPGSLALRPEIAAEPSQTPTDEAPFAVPYAGVSYRVEPLFAYDLHGLVVSYRLHDGNSSMHRRANDHLNVADVCVVWSATAASPTLRKISFWNGDFTCNFETRDGEAWARFAANEVSNNHLLSADERIRERIAGVRVGDQIHVRGLLARYTSPGGTRGTSTTRDDEGNGACETILVEGFEVIEPGHNRWRLVLYGALAALAVGLVVHFRTPYRPYA